jgi:hypothetical protein
MGGQGGHFSPHACPCSALFEDTPGDFETHPSMEVGENSFISNGPISFIPERSTLLYPGISWENEAVLPSTVIQEIGYAELVVFGGIHERLYIVTLNRNLLWISFKGNGAKHNKFRFCLCLYVVYG